MALVAVLYDSFYNPNTTLLTRERVLAGGIMGAAEDLRSTLSDAGLIITLDGVRANTPFYYVGIEMGVLVVYFSGVFVEGYSSAWRTGVSIPVRFDGETRTAYRTASGMAIVAGPENRLCISGFALGDNRRLMAQEKRCPKAQAARPLPAW